MHSIYVVNIYMHIFLFRLECTEKVNQSFGRLDISYTSKFDPYCNWILEDAGILQAVAIVSIHQMNLRENSRYVADLLWRYGVG